MRRVLRALTGVWLACQLVAAASPLALVSDRFGIDQAECCPGIGPGQTCPMHHHSTNKSTCKMESACVHHDAALLTILAVGVLPAPVAASTPVSDTAVPAASEPSSRSRALVPDLPPPRI